MEVKIRAAYANEIPNGNPADAAWTELFCSYFSMVAKSVETGKAQKGFILNTIVLIMIVNRLEPQTAAEKLDFEQGELNQQKRLKFKQESIYSTPPTQEERDLRYLHGNQN